MCCSEISVFIKKSTALSTDAYLVKQNADIKAATNFHKSIIFCTINFVSKVVMAWKKHFLRNLFLWLMFEISFGYDLYDYIMC